MTTLLKIIFLPLIILWKICRMVLPELTRPFDSLGAGIRDIFRSN